MMTFWDYHEIGVVTLANLHIISVLHTADLCLVHLTVSVLDCRLFLSSLLLVNHVHCSV